MASVFYVLSKILDVLLTPLAWCVVLVAAGTFGVQSSSRRRGLSAGGILLLLFFSLEPVSNALYASLESSVLRTVRADVTYDVVILLGGVVDNRVEATSGQRAFNENNERLLETFDLLREGRARYAIVSGGPAPSNRTPITEARALAEQLVAWGIDPDRVVVEGRARNTRENAVESAAIVRARGWKKVLIVTSAYHMSRAYGCFRAVDLDVDALPVDFRSYASPFSGELMPRAQYLDASTAAIREWSGRAIYRARGYSR
jgi:uncharacterized SAM-binding protein YcdF (DUF218 family)